MEPQKTQNCQSNIVKKNKAGGTTFSDFRLYYKSYSNQNNTILAQRQTHRSMDREPRNKPSHFCLINSTTKEKEYTM